MQKTVQPKPFQRFGEDANRDTRNEQWRGSAPKTSKTQVKEKEAQEDEKVQTDEDRFLTAEGVEIRR